VPLTVPAFVSALSALLALATAASFLGVLCAPRWRQHRWLVAKPICAALYAACDIPLTSGWSDGALIRVNSIQLTAAAVFCLIWLRYAEEDLGPLPRHGFRAMALLLGAAVLTFWAPGAAFTGAVHAQASPWAGISYRFSEFTPAGEGATAVLLLALLVIVVRYASAAVRRVDHALPQLAAAVLVSIAACNDSLVALVPDVRVHFPVLLDVGLMLAGVFKGALLVQRWRSDMVALATLSAELESRVEQRSKELEQAMRALSRTERLAAIGRLAAGMAHEINNPAAVVSSNLDYVLECRARGGELPADAGEALTEAREGVRRITDIVRKLLAGAKAARQEDARGFSVADAVHAAADRVRVGMRPDVDLLVEAPAGLTARGSAALLEQVLVDLAGNGEEAVPQGRAGSLRISAAQEGDKVLVRVRDDGSGMDERTVARLFEPFFSTKPVGKGTGLSLAVALALLRSIGGDLRVESEPGRGTTATVVLEALPSTVRAAA